MTRDFANGINVSANLSATNASASEVALSDEEQPWADVLTALPLSAEAIIAGARGLRETLIESTTAALPTTPMCDDGSGGHGHTGGDDGLPIDLAGTMAINAVKHTVEATVGSSAPSSRSSATLEVSAPSPTSSA